MTIHQGDWVQDDATTDSSSEPGLKPILFLGQHTRASDEIRAWVEQFSGRQTFLLIPQGNHDHWIATYAARHAAVMIDIDDVGGREEAVSMLMLFRHFAPEVPVVMLSKEFTEDSFGDPDLSLCAASLKKPTNMLRVVEALAHAMVVHPYHCERAYQMSYDRD